MYLFVLELSMTKVEQTHKFYDFLNLTQFFQIWPDSVLIEINDVNNFIYNYFEYHDQHLKMYHFHIRSF